MRRQLDSRTLGCAGEQQFLDSAVLLLQMDTLKEGGHVPKISPETYVTNYSSFLQVMDSLPGNGPLKNT